MSVPEWLKDSKNAIMTFLALMWAVSCSLVFWLAVTGDTDAAWQMIASSGTVIISFSVGFILARMTR